MKLVFNAPNAAEAIQRIQQAGPMVIAQPTILPVLGNATVGIAKDPDGYTLELMQR